MVFRVLKRSPGHTHPLSQDAVKILTYRILERYNVFNILNTHEKEKIKRLKVLQPSPTEVPARRRSSVNRSSIRTQDLNRQDDAENSDANTNASAEAEAEGKHAAREAAVVVKV